MLSSPVPRADIVAQTVRVIYMNILPSQSFGTGDKFGNNAVYAQYEM